MQPCKTGDQPYSDACPNGECSLNKSIQTQGPLTQLVIMSVVQVGNTHIVDIVEVEKASSVLWKALSGHF